MNSSYFGNWFANWFGDSEDEQPPTVVRAFSTIWRRRRRRTS